MRRVLSFIVFLSLSACCAASQEVSARCDDTVGVWSDSIDGLRGRIVTSDTSSSLHVEIELENANTEPIALHWDGSPSVGFATFALRDATGAEPLPDWEFGGNEGVGALALVIPPSASMARDAWAGFVAGLGGETRALRIGAFWGRPMPEDGSPRYLSAYVVTRAAQAGDTTEEGTSAAGARPWVGILELPSVCID